MIDEFTRHRVRRIFLAAQEKYAIESCGECENWKRRGDELFDELEMNRSVEEGIDGEVEALRSVYDEKCDEYKKLILLNAKLRLLLAENGVDHEM